ncbi:small oligopeptide opt family [Lasallia pustulata]|uniref:Small oligopeptide opt family n=1 Tax=Lasallia pustulata TaxID=136370 RepID=A0A1W5D788_9LECA|nr:small oligopeptide opt family [Lasallia pustulata]
MIQATTNIQLGLNVFTEFIVGYAQPDRPLAMMLFKTYGYITMQQALAFVQDLKLGHYMKVPPRVMFSSQVIATLWSCFVQVAVFEWALGSIPDVCTQTQSNHYSCPNGRVFFNASVIWGLIGPQRIFSPGNIYSGLLWFWLVGALLPVVIYVAARMFPKSNIRYLSAPIIFGGTGYIPPAMPLNYLSWGIIGFVLNKYIMNKYRGWWMRFNYLTSAGLDVGLAISTIVIFLCLDLTNQSPPNWWGNTAPANTMDFLDTAIQKTVAPGEFFGPRTCRETEELVRRDQWVHGGGLICLKCHGLYVCKRRRRTRREKWLGIGCGREMLELVDMARGSMARKTFGQSLNCYDSYDRVGLGF